MKENKIERSSEDLSGLWVRADTGILLPETRLHRLQETGQTLNCCSEMGHKGLEEQMLGGEIWETGDFFGILEGFEGKNPVKSEI